MSPRLHPAENRGYRELYAFSRQLAEHWPRLVPRFPEAADTLERGARAARELLDELGPLTASYGLHGDLAAQGVGASLGLGFGAVRDRFLERNQALRLAVLEVQQLTTLLAYLGAVAASRDDEALAEFCARWVRKLKRIETATRKAAADLGSDPDGAIEPFDPSPAGRAAHSVGYAVGTVGEWVDRQAARRRS
jgi:hypothetical protein